MAAGDPLELLPWLKLAGQGLEASGSTSCSAPAAGSDVGIWSCFWLGFWLGFWP